MAYTPEHNEMGGGPLLISEARKQMLIDNLQLEITERARKLRAQYALQAQGLRARLEMRVNRIPHSLRHITMEELAEKYSQPQTAQAARGSPQKLAYPTIQISAANARGTKRSSDVHVAADKENEHPGGQLDNPKKRVKTAPISTAPPKSSRAVSRKINPSTVLSPKSHNSRTLHTSPVKSSLPTKPSSPVKASVIPKPTNRAVGPTASKQIRSASRQATKPAPRTAQAKSSSQPTGLTTADRPSSGSEVSSSTTIVKKSTATSTTTAAAAKKAATSGSIRSKTAGGIKNAISSLAGSKRVATGTKKTPAAQPTSVSGATSGTTVGGRTLRKRGSLPASPSGRRAMATRGTAGPTPTVADDNPASLAESPPPVPPKDERMPVIATPSRHGSRNTPASAIKAADARTGLQANVAEVNTVPMTTKSRLGEPTKVTKPARRSFVPKRLGSKRLGRIVEKGKGMLTRSRTKAS